MSLRFAYQTPGVYTEETVLERSAQLQTGVPGFIGFVNTKFAELHQEPRSLNRKSEFETLFPGHLAAGSYLAEAVNGFFLNGGSRCYVVCAGIEDKADTGSKEKALKEALQALSTLTDLDLIAIPDAMTLRDTNGLFDGGSIKGVQEEMLKHCEVNGNRLAILDALPTEHISDVIGQRNDITNGMSEPLARPCRNRRVSNRCRLWRKGRTTATAAQTPSVHRLKRRTESVMANHAAKGMASSSPAL